jgi:hypothetical protein
VQDFGYTKDGHLAEVKSRAGTATFAYPAGRRIADERGLTFARAMGGVEEDGTPRSYRQDQRSNLEWSTS